MVYITEKKLCISKILFSLLGYNIKKKKNHAYLVYSFDYN